MNDTDSGEGTTQVQIPDRMEENRLAYREAALAAHKQPTRTGHPLHIVSSLARWAGFVTVAMVVAGLVFATTVRVGEYARGPAVVRREGRLVVTSAVSGTVQSIDVNLGQRVEAGQVMIHLDDAAQRAELERVDRDYEQRLVELLREPADDAARQRLAGLDGQRALAHARAAERAVVAPESGVVSDVRVRPGQPVAPGDAIVAVEQDAAKTVVIGLFPGHVRPLLSAVDTRLYLDLEGFPNSRQAVQVRSVADEVVGPAEAMRYLGRDREGALDLSGPVVMVMTELPSDIFVSDDIEYRMYDGMQGILEARVRSATLLETLIPALQEI